MCRPHGGLGRGPLAPSPKFLRSILQRVANSSLAEQRCPVPSRDSAPRSHHIATCPRRSSSPILQNLIFGTHSGPNAGLSFRIVRGQMHKHADAPGPLGLLRLHRQRPSPAPPSSVMNSRRFMSSIGGPSIPARAGAGQAGGLPHVQPAGGRVTPPRPSEQFYTDSAAPPGLRCSAHRGCVELRDL